MIPAAVLQAGRFTGQRAAEIAGYSSAPSVPITHRRVGKRMGLPRVGPGGRLRLNVRQVAILSICREAHPGGGGNRGLVRRTNRIVDSLMEADDWGEYLVIVGAGSRASRMIDHPEQVVSMALAHGGASVVPLRPFVEAIPL